MATYQIAVIPGDGIGQEVMPEGMKALRAVQQIVPGLHLEFEAFPWGSDYYREHGAMMPEGALKTPARPGMAPTTSSISVPSVTRPTFRITSH